MRKTVRNRDAFYTIAWSPAFPFDKYSLTRMIPELPGLAFFSRRGGDERKPLFIYGCWREGLRLGIKYLFDPLYSKNPMTAHDLLEGSLFIRYAVVDTTPGDMKDVLAALIARYGPPFNSLGYTDSGRYQAVYVKEMDMRKGDVVESIPRGGF